MASSERRWVPWPRGGTIGSQNYTGIMKDIKSGLSALILKTNNKLFNEKRNKNSFPAVLSFQRRIVLPASSKGIDILTRLLTNVDPVELHNK
jgi:hypothetical protein